MDASQIDALNNRFAVPGRVQIVPGSGGLAKVRVTTGLASGDLYLHGAQVTSWQPAGAEEVIFLSAQSHFQDGRAIRGGIPICFPWFRAKADNPQAPAHGFVRTKEWRLDDVSAGEDGSVMVTCSTESDGSTRQWWPHEFLIEHRVTFGSSLRLELIVHNTGAEPFTFEEALHTYFRVGDAQAIRVRGLDGVSFLDNMDANREKLQSGDVALTAPTDNAYLDTRGPVDLMDPVLRRTLCTEKESSSTTIVWNPWKQGAVALSDLGDDEWQQMTCVEASNILASAITLAPGETHTLRATLTVAPEITR
jgi:glucose-6-phosphate 1-epimerase